MKTTHDWITVLCLLVAVALSFALMMDEMGRSPRNAIAGVVAILAWVVGVVRLKHQGD